MMTLKYYKLSINSVTMAPTFYQVTFWYEPK